MYTLILAIEEFIHHCIFEKNLSTKTIKAYKTDLIQFVTFFERNNYPLEVSSICKTEIQHYIEFISFFKPKTKKRKIATVKAFLNYLEFEDKIVSNPIRKLRIKIKEPLRLPRCLSFQEMNNIFKTAYQEYTKTTKYSYQFYNALKTLAIIEILFTTGARVSEISNLKINDVDLVSGRISIKGKGNRERLVQINYKDTINILVEYKNAFDDGKKLQNGPFFTNRLKNKLTDQSIREIVKKISKKAAISKNVTPHVFRHSFASLLLENEVDIKYIQLLLGHSSILTTQIYTHVSNNKINQILKLKHPRKDFCMI